MNVSRRRQYGALILTLLLVSQSFLLSIQAQHRDEDRVIVTVGQPNVWSLEQAHYLLARIRERNLGLSNRALSEEDLDPNATNATTLDAMRSFFEIGASFDQGLGLNNRLNRENLEFNQTRRQELFARRSALFDQKNLLLAESGRLDSELRSLEDGEANKEAIAEKKRQIEANKAQLSATQSQLDNVNAELAIVGAGNTTVAGPTPQAGPGQFANGLGDRIGKTITDNFEKDAARNPRLAASVKLDNYVQMQYELLAKQLTLLRDEVGPNERLVFLELPTSIYATPRRGNDRTVQAWWKVDGYYRQNHYAAQIAAFEQLKTSLKNQLTDLQNGKPAAEKALLQRKYDTQIRGINQDIAAAKQEFYDDRADAASRGAAVFAGPEDRGDGIVLNEGATLLGVGDFIDVKGLAAKLNTPLPAVPPAPPAVAVYSAYLKTLLGPTTQAMLPCDGWACANALAHDLNKVLLAGQNLYQDANFNGVNFSTETKLLAMSSPTGAQLVRLNRMVLEDAYPDEIFRSKTNAARVIDLIPRQSSLNVSDINEVVKERGFKFLFSLLIGIGGSVDYQQRRERFEQFQQQEVYAAGFGKGESTFGWTFSPMPGTKRLAPGTRTTYAVMVVPRDASKLRLKACAVDFPNVDDQITPDFSDATTKTIELDIPNGPGEGFFVTRIDYPHVDVDQRSVVVLRGDFSSQTGILINGTPLARTVGVASPWEKEPGSRYQDLGEPDKTVKGYYEVINSNYIIMTFLMPKGYTGPPDITLISPNRARSLNNIALNFNGAPNKRLMDEYPIGDKPNSPDAPLRIKEIQFSPAQISIRDGKPSATADASVLLDGLKKADPPPQLFFNASECTAAEGNCVLSKIAEKFYRLSLTLPVDQEKISFTVVQKDRVNTDLEDNPAFIRAVETGRRYDAGDEEDVSDDVVTINIGGRRIQDLSADSADARVELIGQLFNQATLIVSEMTKPVVSITLTDTRSNTEVARLVVRRRAPKKKPEPPKHEGSNQ